MQVTPPRTRSSLRCGRTPLHGPSTRGRHRPCPPARCSAARPPRCCRTARCVRGGAGLQPAAAHAFKWPCCGLPSSSCLVVTLASCLDSHQSISQSPTHQCATIPFYKGARRPACACPAWPGDFATFRADDGTPPPHAALHCVVLPTVCVVQVRSLPAEMLLSVEMGPGCHAALMEPLAAALGRAVAACGGDSGGLAALLTDSTTRAAAMRVLAMGAVAPTNVYV